MSEDYGGRFGSLRAVFEEQNEKNGIPQEKTYAEKEAEKKEKLLDGLRDELATYQQAALQKAQERTLASLKDKVSRGELEGESLTEAYRMISNPSLITATATDEDYGDKLTRVRVLLSLIANPEKAEEKVNQDEFIKRMEGYAKRNTKK